MMKRVMKKDIALDCDMMFDFEVIEHNPETDWPYRSLNIDFYQRSDGTFSSRLNINTAQSSDIKDLATIFTEIASKLKELEVRDDKIRELKKQ